MFKSIKHCEVRNMIKKIEAIEEAIKYKCYLPALSLALTIPDICGQIEYPEFKRAKNPSFTEYMCYKLRCAFLHSGNSDIEDFGKKEDDEFIYRYYFNLCLNGCDSWGSTWEIKGGDNGKVIKEINV